MKTILTKGGFTTLISNIQSEFIEKYFNGNELKDEKDLDERENHIAYGLVSSGVLNKTKGKYSLNVNKFGS